MNPNILITGDLHLHERKEFSRVTDSEVSSRLQEGVDILHQIAELVTTMSIPDVIILGDIFELKDRVPNHVLLAFAEAVEKIPARIHILLGNHDFRIKKYSNLKLFDHGDMIRLVDRPTIVEVGEINVGFIPYYRDTKDFELAWERLHHRGGFRLFCFHQPIAGIAYKSGERVPGRFDLPIRDNVRYLAGHIHQHSFTEDKIIMYVGSPYQVNFNEVGEKKYVWLYDTETDELRGVETRYPRFILVDIEDAATAKVEGNYVKITGEIPPDKKQLIIEAKDKIVSRGAKGVVTDVRFIRDVKKRLDAASDAVSHDVVDEYVSKMARSLTRHLDKNVLVSIGRSLVEEAKQQ